MEGPAIGRRRDERGAAPAAATAAQKAEAAAYAAGMARAETQIQARVAELNARIANLDSILRQLAHPLRLLDAEVEEALLALAVAIGSQLARRELHADPAQVIAVVREGLQQLPLGARDVRVRLHPQDAAVVRERLALPAGEGAWQLVEDPTLTRGGCLIQSEHSRVDSRLESRIQALVAAAMGDERTGRRPTESGAPEGAT